MYMDLRASWMDLLVTVCSGKIVEYVKPRFPDLKIDATLSVLFWSYEE